MADTFKGGLTLFWELFYRDSLRSQKISNININVQCYLKNIGSEIKNEGSLELEKAILRFLA